MPTVIVEPTLSAAKQQVVLDLLVAQTDILQAVVTHVGRRVTVQAVIDEHLRAALDRDCITHLLGRRAIKLDRLAGCHRKKGGAEHAQKQFFELFHDSGFQCPVTRSGTGLVLSIAV
jgi:hypothetical protein